MAKPAPMNNAATPAPTTGTRPVKHGTAWGIEKDGAVLYDAMFRANAARRIAKFYNEPNPPKDWEETSNRLLDLGFTPKTIFTKGNR